jgi:tRNA pseudouridine38-40 synthase
VHARGNALTVSSELSGASLLRALNVVAPDIFFTHARSVPDSFRPRGATSRWYRYFEPSGGRSLARYREGARLLVGPIDARSFGRGFPAGTPTPRTIDRIEVRAQGDLFEIDVRARSFVWGMVRKIVAALRGFDAGEISREELGAGAAGDRRLALPMAEPDGLVLWEVEYPAPWEIAASRRSPRQQRFLAETRQRHRVRDAVLEALEEVRPADLDEKTAVGL